MTSYYTDLPFMARSSCSYCMDVPFMVDSIDSSAVSGPLQFFRSMHPAHFTGNDAAFDGFIKIQFARLKGLDMSKPRQTVAETVLKFPPLSYLSSFVYVFKLH